MLKKLFIYTAWVVMTTLILASCYEEKHFDMPGMVEVEDESDIDSMPFPFDATHQAGEFLIKDGVVDFSRVSFMGFTDFVPTIGGDTTSWYQGDGFYGNIQHKVFYPTNATQFGGVNYSYDCNHAYFRPFLQIGPGKKWYVYARMSLEYLNNTQVFFWFGGDGFGKRDAAGMDYGMSSRFYGMVNGNEMTNYENWPTGPELLMPGETFEVELACVDCFVYYRVNGRLLWFYNLPSDAHSMPLSFHPGGNSAKLYDVYIEGDYEEQDQVAWRQEGGYTTIQRPALTQNGNEVWLFAEGRVNNCALTTDTKARRSNATDIVMKRSTDGGNTWSELSLVAGNKQAVNIRPEVVTGSNGTTHLFYTVDNSGLFTGDYSIYTTTSNNGTSWSAPQRIVSDLEGDYQVTTVAGHGLETQAGRLIVPVYCQKSNEKNMAVLYSDDQGATWQSGSIIPNETDAANCNVVELADGRLMMVIGRSTGTATDRRFSYSTDGGETWSEPESATIPFADAYGPRFQGATVVKSDGQLVHFTPASRVQGSYYNDNNLKGMRIYGAPSDLASNLKVTVSDNNGADWTEPVSLFKLQAFKDYKFLSGNMDAIVLNDGSILCITEGGALVPYEGLISFRYN